MIEKIATSAEHIICEDFSNEVGLKVAIKERVRPFIPPIVWSAMARATKRRQASQSSVARGFSEIISDQHFRIGFHRVSQESGDYFVPVYADQRPASKAILSGTLYEPETHELIKGILNHRRGDIVHAGAFFGDMLPTFSRACSGTVYAFEPVFENFVLAKLCIQENDLENIFLFNAGLGSTIQVAKVDTGGLNEPHRGGGSSVGSKGQLTGLIPIDSLGLENLSIIQLDVEGYELNALQGAKNTIASNAPIIMIEDNNRKCGPFLKSFDYRKFADIPGLAVWSRTTDLDLLRTLL